MSDKQGTQWYDLDDLMLWDSNPNVGDIGSIITSISKHGYNDVIAVYHGTIMGGNHRLQALQQLLSGGYVPTNRDTQLRAANGSYQITGMDVSHFETQQEANAFALALNRTARLGHDDPAMLAALLQDIAAQDVKLLESTGFSGDDLDDLLLALNMPDGNVWGNSLENLPEGDRQPFQQMTFTIHDSQLETIINALKAAKANDFTDSQNENSNGNALHFVCGAFNNG